MTDRSSCLAVLLIISMNMVFTPVSSAQIPLGIQDQNFHQQNWRRDPVSAFNARGVRLSAIYTGDVITNRMGGIRNGTNYLDVIDLMCTLNLDSLINWKNAIFCMDVLGTHGGDPSNYTGDFQGVSNIAAVSSWRMYEMWLQQNFPGERLSALIGVYDVNSEFDVIETAGLFINSSFSMGPEFSLSGKNGAPTFPYPGLAIRIKTRLSNNVSIQTALMDGVPGDPDNPRSTQYRLSKEEGALLLTELVHITGAEGVAYFPSFSRRIQNRRRRAGFDESRRIPLRRGPRRGRGEEPGTVIPLQRYSKVALGGWYYTSEFDDLTACDIEGNPVIHKGSWGIYGLGEKILFINKDNPSEFMSAFFRAGISDKNVNCIDRYLGCGIVFSQSFIRHDPDQLGLAVAAAHMSNKYMELTRPENGTNHDWEVALELSYRAQVNSILAVQPDMQYVINPGFESSVENVLIIGMRLELAFQ